MGCGPVMSLGWLWAHRSGLGSQLGCILAAWSWEIDQVTWGWGSASVRWEAHASHWLSRGLACASTG